MSVLQVLEIHSNWKLRYELANVKYIRACFFWPYRSACSRVGRRLLRYMCDMELANRLQYLQEANNLSIERELFMLNFQRFECVERLEDSLVRNLPFTDQQEKERAALRFVAR